jgi:hypothetical protein
MKRLPAHWRPTGWHINRVIEYSYWGPAGIESRVYKKRPGDKAWYAQIGHWGHDRPKRGPFKTSAAAVDACEGMLRLALRSALRTLS